MDGLIITANEVALEGLDGITLPSLWLRLENRQPKFPLKLDEPTKELLWRSLTSDADLKFYQNPQERDDIVLLDRWALFWLGSLWFKWFNSWIEFYFFPPYNCYCYIKATVFSYANKNEWFCCFWKRGRNPSTDVCLILLRFDDIDPETGIEIKQSFNERVKDVYPIHIVENRDGIQGSCAFFTQRTDVTKHIRSKSFTPLLSLQEVMERLVQLDCFRFSNQYPLHVFKDTTIKLQHFINSGSWTDEKILPFILTVLLGQIWPKACCCGVPEDAIQGTDREWKRSRFEAHGWLLLRAGTSGPSALARGAAEGSTRALVQVRRSITVIHRSCQETNLMAVLFFVRIDARKLHYLRISLVKHGLVTMQSHCTRLKTGQQQHSILLLLKRFHINRSV